MQEGQETNKQKKNAFKRLRVTLASILLLKVALI